MEVNNISLQKLRLTLRVMNAGRLPHHFSLFLVIFLSFILVPLCTKKPAAVMVMVVVTLYSSDFSFSLFFLFSVSGVSFGDESGGDKEGFPFVPLSF